MLDLLVRLFGTDAETWALELVFAFCLLVIVAKLANFF